MNERSDIDQLLDLITEQTGIETARLTDDTSLFYDLGIAGMDGFEIVDAIGETFDIDVSNAPVVDYFGEEAGYNPIYHLWCFLRGRRLDEGIVQLRISDLKRVVREGRWPADLGHEVVTPS